MSIASFIPFTESELDEIFILNEQIIQESLQITSGKQRFQLILPDPLLQSLSTLLSISLINPLPAEVVKGDTVPHTEEGPATFAATHLLYLTSIPGSLILANSSYPIERGVLYRFPSGIVYGTIGTGEFVRLTLGPFNEFQDPVRAIQSLS